MLIVDVVTERQESLHQEILDLLELNGAVRFDATLYTIAYRTVEETKRLEMWAEPLAVGSPLPTMPLWLTPELAVPVHLEEAYERACRSLRIQ